MNLSLFASYAGDFPTSEREARTVLQTNPSYEKAYLTLAYAQLGQGQSAHAAETYQKLEKISALGASLGTSGLADLALYEGRFSEAVQILEKAAAVDLAAKNARAAEKLVALAHTQLLRGEKRRAVAAAERSTANTKRADIRFLAARIFVEAGELARARELSAGLATELSADPQAYAKLIEGEVALKRGNVREAIKAFSEAKALADTWLGRFDLGRAYVEAGSFGEADSEFDRCIKRRGEALELDNAPTYGYFPPVYYYQGRVREGLKSPGSAESYRMYLDIRGKAGEDPVLADVRRRLGQ
jgi:tetratricopeptide (TPR) repeat protein